MKYFLPCFVFWAILVNSPNKQTKQPEDTTQRIRFHVFAELRSSDPSKDFETRANPMLDLVTLEAKVTLSYPQRTTTRGKIQLSEIEVPGDVEENKDLEWCELLSDSRKTLESSVNFMITQDGVKIKTLDLRQKDWLSTLLKNILSEILGRNDPNTSKSSIVEYEDGNIIDLDIETVNIPKLFTKIPERDRSSRKCVGDSVKKIRKTIKESALSDKIHDLFSKPLPSVTDELTSLEAPAKQQIAERKLNCNKGLSDFAEEVDRNNFDDAGVDKIKEIEKYYNGRRHHVKFYYNYILMRASDLENGDDEIDLKSLTFTRFLVSCFYFGKGTNWRLLQHLVDANKDQWIGAPTTNLPTSSKTQSTAAEKKKKSKIDAVDDLTKIPNAMSYVPRVKSSEESEKLKTINEEWDKGYGIVAFRVRDLIHSNEAHIREAFMIDSYGRDYLTNKVRGIYFKDISRMEEWVDDPEVVSSVGAHLLYDAYLQFKETRIRPIYRHDIDGITL